jgi:2'-5' RNA ligase
VTDDVSPKRRLFAGIVLDDAVRAGCADAAARLRAAGFVANYEDPAKLHATLAFLGNVEASRYDDVVNALHAAAGAGSPFDVTLDKVGAFPHERKPRIVYAGARDPGAPFRALAQTVRAEFQALGFTFKDDAVVHVTIARAREPRRPLPLVDLPPLILNASRIALFESIYDKEKSTSRYEVLVQAPLRSVSAA